MLTNPSIEKDPFAAARPHLLRITLFEAKAVNWKSF